MEKRLYKIGGEIIRSNILKADSYQELQIKIRKRINGKYSSSKVKWIWKIQDLFRNSELVKLPNGYYEYDHSKLYSALEFTIEKKANWLEKKYKYVRLSFHDFEAELWKITYDAIDYYEIWVDDTEFTLVETLELYWKTRMIDFIKSCLYTIKHGDWYKSASLSEDFESVWPDNNLEIEKQLLYKQTVAEMLAAVELNEQERKLLYLIYDYPSRSYREWGKELGINHPEKVRRLFLSIQKRLTKYNPFI
ncbi:hypothetical protein JYA63_17370 [Fictibacillus nanhaiensis]|uniref:Sigma-70 family RNA polymerase sigma factor n=1 Tax=Fictibacillus nanhaiensis TaxID=742169 RepID=A0ABS2ZUU5_9BACL|nr:hypothetical protein [Fictibacillus nanhaiensis]